LTHTGGGWTLLETHMRYIDCQRHL
jgi:hypothetical protein